MKNWQNWLSYGLIGLMLLLNLIYYSDLPDQMPTHWDLKGQADRFASKGFALAIGPGVALFLTLLITSLIRLGSLTPVFESNQHAYVTLGMTFLMFCIHLAGLMNALQPGQFRFEAFVTFGLGILSICLGLSMKNIQPNAFVGIRTPWTLASRDTWTATHKIASKVFILCGISTLIAVQSTIGLVLAIVLTLVAAIGSAGYSFHHFRKLAR